jgi:hypothetical protein
LNPGGLRVLRRSPRQAGRIRHREELHGMDHGFNRIRERSRGRCSTTRKTRRFQFLALALLASGLAVSAASAGTITTRSYDITLSEHCNEDVACQDVAFTIRKRGGGDAVRLEGRAVTSLCRDGITPCHHQGYEFVDGDTRYFVSDDGWLEITRKRKLVLHEDILSRQPD